MSTKCHRTGDNLRPPTRRSAPEYFNRAISHTHYVSVGDRFQRCVPLQSVRMCSFDRRQISHPHTCDVELRGEPTFFLCPRRTASKTTRQIPDVRNVHDLKEGQMPIRVQCTRCQFTADLTSGRYVACPQCGEGVSELVIDETQASGSPRVSIQRRLRAEVLHSLKASIARQLQSLYGHSTSESSNSNTPER